MKLKLITVALVALFLLGCVSVPSATGEQAVAVSTASNAISAQSVEEVLTQNVNISVQFMLLLMAATTFVPNPFQLINKAVGMLFNGISTLWKLFK